MRRRLASHILVAPNMAKRALITGITGQDGSFLAELLLAKDYEVHGVVRRTSTLERTRIDHLTSNPEIYNKSLFLHYAELSEPIALRRVIDKSAPDEVYHLAGQSHVGISFEIPETTLDMTATGTLRLLEMMRDYSTQIRFFHASSSEIFGRPDHFPQNETCPFKPVNPYGCAKAYATLMTDVYRETYGLFACNGILYNHESQRRGENFVTRKICRGAAQIKAGLKDYLTLGDVTSLRDWGHAEDYVQGMWLALQQDAPENYVFATGELHSVDEVVQTAFIAAGLDPKKFIRQDPRFMRPSESTRLVGDASKAKNKLGWAPKWTFTEMIESMTRHEIKLLSQGK